MWFSSVPSAKTFRPSNETNHNTAKHLYIKQQCTCWIILFSSPKWLLALVWSNPMPYKYKLHVATVTPRINMNRCKGWPDWTPYSSVSISKFRLLSRTHSARDVQWDKLPETEEAFHRSAEFIYRTKAGKALPYPIVNAKREGFSPQSKWLRRQRTP